MAAAEVVSHVGRKLTGGRGGTVVALALGSIVVGLFLMLIFYAMRPYAMRWASKVDDKLASTKAKFSSSSTAPASGGDVGGFTTG